MAKEEVLHSTRTETEGNPSSNNDPSESLKSCSHSKTGRNLVVCIDGTANQFGVNVSMSLDSSCVL